MLPDPSPLRVNRRQFLKRAAAVAVAAPLVVPASVLGRADRPAPSERITVGFIGCGKMANEYHLPQLLGFKDVQALAVCEVDAARRAHAKGRVDKAYETRTDFAGCTAYSDFRELLARKDIDAVCIATPEHGHASPPSRRAKRARTSTARSR